jgi:hypothetical protein
MTTLRYPLSALLTDYALGFAGTAICLVMIITSGWTSHIIWLFIALTLCCVVYTMRTILQHRTIIGVDEGGITRTLFGSDRRIDWDRLAGLSLRYYPRRRQKKKGMGGVLGRLGRVGFSGSGADRQGESDQPRSPLADGWMVLTLRDDKKQRITIDSGLPHFFALSEHAAKAARQRNLDIDPVTDDNLQALASLPADLLSPASTSQGSADPFAESNS